MMICKQANYCTVKSPGNKHCSKHEYNALTCLEDCRYMPDSHCIHYEPEMIYERAKECVSHAGGANKPLPDVKPKNEKWYVLVEGSLGCMVEHPDGPSARKEAERLAQMPDNIGKNVFVLQIQHVCTAYVKTTVVWRSTEKE